jgi:pimeloyl-ACP methyl ester carboxylesterase
VSRPPLLLINGYAATKDDWDPTFLEAIERSHRVIRPDNRGVGTVELGDAELTVDLMADDLERLLDREGIERLPVVGWSMGGFVTQRLALRAPQRVSALVLIASDPGGPGAVRAAPEVWARLVDHAGTPREQASRLIALLFPPPLASQIDRQFGELVAEARARLSLATLSAQEAAIEAWYRDEQSAPDASAPPTLVLHGAEDVVIPSANAEVVGTRWAAARVELFAGCAHAVMAQEPAAIAATIRDHVSRDR